MNDASQGAAWRHREIAIYANRIREVAVDRWLKTEEIFCLLKNYEVLGFTMCTKPVTNPRHGILLIFDRRRTRNFKDDGVAWVKKNNKNRVREDHVKLQLRKVNVVYGTYAHGEQDSFFHRRCYRLAGPPNAQNIHLVHYRRDIKTDGDRSSIPSAVSTPMCLLPTLQMPKMAAPKGGRMSPTGAGEISSGPAAQLAHDGAAVNGGALGVPAAPLVGPQAALLGPGASASATAAAVAAHSAAMSRAQQAPMLKQSLGIPYVDSDPHMDASMSAMFDGIAEDLGGDMATGGMDGAFSSEEFWADPDELAGGGLGIDVVPYEGLPSIADFAAESRAPEGDGKIIVVLQQPLKAAAGESNLYLRVGQGLRSAVALNKYCVSSTVPSQAEAGAGEDADGGVSLQLVTDRGEPMSQVLKGGFRFQAAGHVGGKRTSASVPEWHAVPRLPQAGDGERQAKIRVVERLGMLHNTIESPESFGSPWAADGMDGGGMDLDVLQAAGAYKPPLPSGAVEAQREARQHAANGNSNFAALVAQQRFSGGGGDQSLLAKRRLSPSAARLKEIVAGALPKQMTVEAEVERMGNGELQSVMEELLSSIVNQFSKDGSGDGQAWILQEMNKADETGCTLLHYAAHFDLTNMIPLLLDQGVARDVRNMDGETPLHLACAKGGLRTIQYLIAGGCSLEVANKEGMFPQDCAAKRGQNHVVEWLTRHGVRLSDSVVLEPTAAANGADGGSAKNSGVEDIGNAGVLHDAFQSLSLHDKCALQLSLKTNRSKRESLERDGEKPAAVGQSGAGAANSVFNNFFEKLEGNGAPGLGLADESKRRPSRGKRGSLDVLSQVINAQEAASVDRAMMMMSPEELAQVENEAKIIARNVKAWFAKKQYDNLRVAAKTLQSAWRGRRSSRGMLPQDAIKESLSRQNGGHVDVIPEGPATPNGQGSSPLLSRTQVDEARRQTAAGLTIQRAMFRWRRASS